MKLSCLSLSYRDGFASGSMTVESFVEACFALRLDSVDIHTRAFRSDDRGHLLAVKRLLLKRGLDLACVAISNDFAKSGDALRADIENAKKWTAHAALLGAPLVRLFAGFVREGVDARAAWQRTVDGLRECAEHGERVGVAIALQNHNHGGLTKTGDDVVRMMKEVNHPHLVHCLDTGQYVGSKGASGSNKDAPVDEGLYKSIEQTAPLAAHVRAKLYRIETGEEKWLDYPRIFKILEGVHYNGVVSLVYEGWQYESETTAMAKGAKFLRRFVA